MPQQNELKEVLNESLTALRAASGAYKLLEDLNLGTHLPGLGHTTESNKKAIINLENFISTL